MKPFIYFEEFEKPIEKDCLVGDKPHILKIRGEWKCDHPEVETAMMYGCTSTTENAFYSCWRVGLKNGKTENFIIKDGNEEESLKEVENWVNLNS